MPNNIKLLKVAIKKVIASKKRRPKKEEVNVPVEVRKEIIREIMTQLAVFTPVDTGALAGGWNVGINKAPERRARASLKNKKPAATNLKKIEKMTAGSTVYIVNVVPYGGYVNFGTSKQPAKGFVELAMFTAQANLAQRGIKVELGV